MGNRILCIVIGAGFLSGCVSAESRWQEAQQQNTVSAYEGFTREFPNAEHTSQARDRIEQIKAEQAKTTGTEAALEAYLKEYPTGRYAADIASRLHQIRLETARKANTLAAFEAFLRQYPDGPDAEQIRKGLPSLREWESKQRLGEVVMRMSPKAVSMNMQAETFQFRTPGTVAQDMSELRRLLDSGADPNAIRILGWRRASFIRLSSPGFSSSMSDWGEPGEVVPPERGGVSLLKYATENEMQEVAELLKSHGAK